MNATRRICALFLFAMCALTAPVASAQSAEAQSRAFFDQGRAFADAGKWADACPRFQAAHDLHATGGTALQSANCYEKIGNNEKAIEMYQWILDHKDREKNNERISIAEDRIRALKGAPQPPPPSSTAQPPASSTPMVPPASAPTTAPLAPTADTTSPPPPPDEGPSHAPAFAALAVGGVGFAVMGIFGGLALSEKSKMSDGCRTGPDCQPSDKGPYDDAKTFGVVSDVGLVVGGLGVATGVVLFLATGKKSSAASASARGLSIKF